MIDVRIIQLIPEFAAIAPPALRELAARGVERRYGSRQVLFRAGRPSPGMFLVLEGRVRVVRDRADRRQVVHTEGPGATLAEVPLFDGGVLPATAVATLPTRCLVFSREAIAAAIGRDPRLALLLLAHLSRRVRHLVARLDRLSFTSVRARLADYVLQRAGETGGQFMLEGTQTDLAQELGTVREVLVRELRYMRSHGLVCARGRRCEVLDATALRRLADGYR
jgi:CRP/FNR family transcriptional regulator, dissimilatory nitrate respiration regulator